jgi:hypothetical protein
MLLARAGTPDLQVERENVFGRGNNSKMLLTVTLAVAVLAVAIPTCQMIGCDMSAMCGTMMRISPAFGLHMDAPCGGVWVTSSSQAGIVPTNFLTLILALMVAFGLAALFFSPKRDARPLFVMQANAPPPPLEPRGERYLL